MEFRNLVGYWREVLILCAIFTITEVTGQAIDPCKGQCGPGTKCTPTGTCVCETGYHRFSLIVSPDAVVAHCFRQATDPCKRQCGPGTKCTPAGTCVCETGYHRFSLIVFPDAILAHCFQTCDLTRNGCAPNTTCVTNLYNGEPFCKCDEGFSRSSSAECQRDEPSVSETSTVTVDHTSTSTKNGITPEITTVTKNETESAAETNLQAQTVGIALGIILAVLLVVVAIIGVMLFIRRGKRLQENGNGIVHRPMPESENSTDNSEIGVSNVEYNDTEEPSMWERDSYSVLPLHVVSSFKPESRQSTDEKSNSNSQNPYADFDLPAPSNTNSNESHI